MRIAIALGGSDLGKSGIGVYVREIVPRLCERAAADGGSVVVLGSPEDLCAYRDDLRGAETAAAGWARPELSALWHILRAGDAASAAQADVLLMPAANRRVAIGSAVPVVSVVHDPCAVARAGKVRPPPDAVHQTGSSPVP